MKKLFIGVSGWAYPHWRGIFYPKNLKPKEELKYFSHYFKTVEVNYSFYRLPEPAVYKNWYSQTPGNFLFAVKASRFITHIKRLKDVRKPWSEFLKNASNLKEKLGPILFQFPPNFKATKENIRRLETFLCYSHKTLRNNNTMALLLRLAMEFRNETWRNEKIYEILRKYNTACVIADSPRYPKVEVITADFVYIRMHGGEILYGSNYSKKELKDWAERIKKYLKQKLDVFCYFNNDLEGYALGNAKTLIDFFKIETSL